MKAPILQTHTAVQDTQTELDQRREAERRCLLCELRLYFFMTALSQAVTVLLAQTGAAAPGVLLLCLLPGALLTGLAALCKRLTHAPTLTEAFRAGLHPAAARCWQAVLALLLLWQGESVLTDMVCLFTEGVATNAAPLGMAAVTLAAALACSQAGGLARCTWLLRLPLLAVTVLLGADLIGKGRVDHFLPWEGGGLAVNLHLLRIQSALGWPMLLFADLPPRSSHVRRDAGPVPPGALLLVLTLAAVFALPTELALTARNLADAMLLPIVFLTPTNRLLALTGWMVGLLLALAVSLRRCGEQLHALTRLRPTWTLEGGAALALLLPHLAGTQTLRGVLKLIQPFLLLPAAVLLLALTVGALCRRRRRT